MKHTIKRIEANYRPEFPVAGWLVQYDLTQYGWKYAKWFETESEAQAFAVSL